MAPTPTPTPTATPSSSTKSTNSNNAFKTPQAKTRLNFNSTRQTPTQNHHHPSPNPNTHTNTNNTNNGKGSQQCDHPIEVVGRIRDYPDKKDKTHVSILQLNQENNCTLRVRADIGYRDFTLDGVSFSEEEDLDAFYKKFVEERINAVKLGDRCTIMMYGPTGSGKSHTMFGCLEQPGIVYRSLKNILGEGGGDSDGDGEKGLGVGTFVQVSVLEIYNEEIYDLLSSNGGGGFGIGWPKGGSASKVRLEVMGKKVKNATFISGTEAGKISKEIQKVEKRRIVKSTLCNNRSSRSHCMIILDVPTVGGRLMLVDMAGSENIEQAGQNGFEAKMQTAKINQGNIALKRVVESIANGDSHVPFRDSKLTMLLQDSFEDDKSKILMILCASPDPKEMYKTICTLEYGAKAKCIVRGPHTPVDKIGTDDSSAVVLGSRIAAMDQFIYKLQRENKLREKEKAEAQKQLMKKEEEIAALRALIEEKGSSVSEEEINLKVNERTKLLKLELDKKLEECRRMAEEFVEMERRRIEERMLQQQREVEMLRRRLEEIEVEMTRSSGGNNDGSSFASRLLGAYGDEDPGMVKSMDLDMGDQESASEVKCVGVFPRLGEPSVVISNSLIGRQMYGEKASLSTVFEEEEEVGEEEEYRNEKAKDEEVLEEVLEGNTVVDVPSTPTNTDSLASRQMRIQNIFTLCGNYRELSQNKTPIMATGVDDSVVSSNKENSPALKRLVSDAMPLLASKENYNPSKGNSDGQIDVHVKWEAGKGNSGKFITTLKVVKDATLADLRKLIEIYLAGDNQAFAFLVLGDPSGEGVPKEKEQTFLAMKLPTCYNQTHGYLACLRPINGTNQPQMTPLLPLSPLENKLPLTPLPPQIEGLSPKLAAHLNSTPFVAQRR